MVVLFKVDCILDKQRPQVSNLVVGDILDLG